MLDVLLADAAATEALGRALAARLRAGDVVALQGDLGAGKSTLARGVLAGLGYSGDAPSPTFPIIIPYDLPEVRLPVWHVDLYRLEDEGEVAELGLDEALAEGALLIEWPERLGAAWRRDALTLSLVVEQGGARRLTATVSAAWAGRWPP